MKISQAFGVLLAAFLAAGEADAAVTFNYVGKDFTSGPSGAPPIDPALGLRITASVVFDDTITPDFDGQVRDNSGVPAQVLSYEISSGPITFAYGTPGSHEAFGLEFEFFNGEIVSWLLFIQSDDLLSVLQTFASGGGTLVDYATNRHLNAFDSDGNYARLSGIWTRASTVPVPSTIWLLGPALGGLGLMRRRLA